MGQAKKSSAPIVRDAQFLDCPEAQHFDKLSVNSPGAARPRWRGDALTNYSKRLAGITELYTMSYVVKNQNLYVRAFSRAGIYGDRLGAEH